MQNFWIAASGIFGVFAVTWSLAIEEQFYLTLPAVIRFIDQRWVPRLLVVGIVGAPIVRVLGAHLWPQHLLGAFTLMPCRADALLLGVLGAYVFRSQVCKWLDNNHYALWGAGTVLLLGAGGLTLRFHAVTDALMISVGYTWMALLYLCVLLLAVTQPRNWLGTAMRWRWLRLLGSIAYGVYLVHLQIAFIVFRVMRRSMDLKLHTRYDAVAMSIAAAITLAVCAISWRYFEKPLIQLGHEKSIHRVSQPT